MLTLFLVFYFSFLFCGLQVAHELLPDYSLFLLNVFPAFVDRAGEGGDPVSYGYQWGFSQEHMKQLVQNPRIIDAAKARLRSEQVRRVYKHGECASNTGTCCHA